MKQRDRHVGGASGAAESGPIYGCRGEPRIAAYVTMAAARPFRKQSG